MFANGQESVVWSDGRNVFSLP